MKKNLLVVLFMFMLLKSPAQGVSPLFIEDITAKPFLRMNTSGIEGTPFQVDDWMLGQVKLADGRIAQNVLLRFSLFDNRLFFKRNGQELEFADPVVEFSMPVAEENNTRTILFRSQFPACEEHTASSYYEILSDGKIQLLKYLFKTLEEYKPYNQAPKQRFVDREAYFVFSDGKMSRIKKDKASIVSALPAFARAINTLVDSQKLRLKDEAVLVRLFTELNNHNK